MPTQATNVADALISSLNDLDRLKFTDAMSPYQNTIALKRIFKKKKTTFESGNEIQFNAIIDHNHSARDVPLGYINVIGIPNVMATGKMPWRHTTWNWAMERRLIAMNSGKAKIIDIAQEQRIAAFGSAILHFEARLWACPSLADFDLRPVGIPYFVVKSATAANTTNNDGFNGLVPSGYTLVANINPSTDWNGRYVNYADAYSAVTKEDLITKMRRAQHYTDFEPLVDGMPINDVGHDYGIYGRYNEIATMESILEDQNDNLGNDIASKDGKVLFMGTPITKVKQLDSDTTGPIYMLDWNAIMAMGLATEWMREQHFPAELNQPTISATVTDCTWNLICKNRRKQAVISNGTTMPSS